MPKIVWDKLGEHFYETGVDHGVLYPLNVKTGAYDSGVAWNGLTGITESPSGAESTAIWADNMKYLSIVSAEEFGATVEAYTYPPEFMECDGNAELVAGVHIGQQTRKTFGLSYRTKIGNDTAGSDHGYKIHLIYGAVAAPSEKAFTTVSDNTEPIALSWELTTTPVTVEGFKPTASLVIDSTTVDPQKLKAFEDILYGTESEKARLPMPDEVKTLLSAA